MAFKPTRLPSTKWQGGFRHPVTRRKVTATFQYEWEAEAWAVTEEAKAKAGAMEGATTALYGPPVAEVAPTPTGVTINAYGADWFARKATKVKSTRTGYAWSLRAIEASDLGARPMADVRPKDVQRWQADLAASGLGPRSVNAHVKVLRMVYRDAVRNGEAPGDATTGVDLLAEPIPADADLSDDAVDALAAAAPTPAYRALVLLGADAGLRYSEAAGLSVGAVVGDFVVIRQVLERTTGKIRRFPKGKRVRHTPVATARLRDALDALLAEAGTDPDALLLTTEAGAPLGYDNFRHRVWPKMKRTAGVRLAKGQGIHQLRHHTGTKLARRGMARHDVAKFLGHADQKTTARYISPTDDGVLLALAREAMAPQTPRPDLRVVAS